MPIYSNIVGRPNGSRKNMVISLKKWSNSEMRGTTRFLHIIGSFAIQFQDVVVLDYSEDVMNKRQVAQTGWPGLDLAQSIICLKSDLTDKKNRTQGRFGMATETFDSPILSIFQHYPFLIFFFFVYDTITINGEISQCIFVLRIGSHGKTPRSRKTVRENCAAFSLKGCL